MSDVQTVTCFISIGLKKELGGGTLENKVMVEVNLEKQTISQAAKMFRKWCACRLPIWKKTPSKLWWAVYKTPTAKVPFMISGSSAQIKTLKNKIQKEKIGGLQSTFVNIDEWDKMDRIFRASGKSGIATDILLKAIEEPSLTAKELIVVGKKVEMELKNARKPRQNKSAA